MPLNPPAHADHDEQGPGAGGLQSDEKSGVAMTPPDDAADALAHDFNLRGALLGCHRTTPS